VQIRGGLADRGYRLADRAVRGQIEAQRHGRELTLVVHARGATDGLTLAIWLNGTMAPLADFA